jgi:hypothetical protein
MATTFQAAEVATCPSVAAVVVPVALAAVAALVSLAPLAALDTPTYPAHHAHHSQDTGHAPLYAATITRQLWPSDLEKGIKRSAMDTAYTLDRDQYLFLLNLYEPTMALGIEYPFSSLEDEKAAMEQALRTLQDKGWITLQEDNIAVAPELGKLVSLCATGQEFLIAAYVDGKQEQDTRFFHVAEEMIVEDKVLPSSGRQLTAIPDWEQAVKQLSEQFRLESQPAAPGQACALAASTLETVRESVGQGEKNLFSLLKQAGTDDATAGSLARLFAAPVSNSTLIRVISSENAASASFVLLESADGLWEMHFLENDQVHLTPVTAETATQMIASFGS